MTCPNCGAPVQPGDSFCVSCGHALHPADPTRRLGEPAYSAGAVGDAAPGAMSPGPAPYRSPVVESPRGEKTWASGSSFPPPNPYADPPHPVSRGTMLNGRPVGSRRGGSGVLKGLGAAIIVLWLISHGLVFGHAGGLVLLVILLLIAGSMRRSRMI